MKEIIAKIVIVIIVLALLLTLTYGLYSTGGISFIEAMLLVLGVIAIVCVLATVLNWAIDVIFEEKYKRKKGNK